MASVLQCYTTPHCIAPRTSHRTASYRTAPHHTTPHYIASYRIASHHIIVHTRPVSCLRKPIPTILPCPVPSRPAMSHPDLSWPILMSAFVSSHSVQSYPIPIPFPPVPSQAEAVWWCDGRSAAFVWPFGRSWTLEIPLHGRRNPYRVLRVHCTIPHS